MTRWYCMICSTYLGDDAFGKVGSCKDHTITFLPRRAFGEGIGQPITEPERRMRHLCDLFEKELAKHMHPAGARAAVLEVWNAALLCDEDRRSEEPTRLKAHRDFDVVS